MGKIYLLEQVVDGIGIFFVALEGVDIEIAEDYKIKLTPVLNKIEYEFLST